MDTPLDKLTEQFRCLPGIGVKTARKLAYYIVQQPTGRVEGEATALYLSRLIKTAGIRVTRIARGLPMGGDIEYADEATLAGAVANRQEM